jgi:hypothetical protein
VKSILRVLLLFLLLNVALAQRSGPLQLQDAPELQGKPGDYLTLVFQAQGNGDYTFEMDSPEGWEALSKSRNVTVENTRPISFTIRVPLDARADEVAQYTLRALVNGTEVARARAQVRVLAVGGVELRALDEVESIPGVPVEFELYVINRGNRADTIELSTVGSIWPVTFNPSSMRLEVGESRLVKVTLFPQGQFSSGFIYVLRTRGQPSLDPNASAEAQVLFRFDAGLVRNRERTNDLQLVFGVNAVVGASLGLTGGASPAFGIGAALTPGLGGELSDFVKGAIDTTGGNISLSLPGGVSFPGGINFGLRAINWDTALRFSGGEVVWTINYALGDWRLGGSVAYRSTDQLRSLGFGLNATSLIPGVDVKYFASFLGTASVTPNQPGSRNDAIGANWRTRLLENLRLSLEGALVGTSSSTSDYNLNFSVGQSLDWQTQDVQVLQTYSALPFAGQHSLGLFVGLRNTTPFGVRGNTSLTFTVTNPIQFTWRNTVVGSVTPIEGLSLGAVGSYGIQTQPGYAITWGISGAASYNFNVPGVLLGVVTGNAGHFDVVVGNVARSDVLGFGVNLNFGDFRVAAEGSWRRDGPTANNPPSEIVSFGVQGGYAFSSATALAAAYSYGLRFGGTTSIDRHQLRFSWAQLLTSTIIGNLSYTRSWDRNLINSTITGGDTFSLGVAFRDSFGVQGLTTSVAWNWSSPTFIFDSSQPSSHSISVNFGYNIALPFVTPQFLTDLFGGRRSGSVTGVAYLDTNLNNEFDPGEPVLPGVSVRLGRETAVTDAQGRYTLRVPVGTYRFDFPAGLDAGLDLLGERNQEIALNESRQRDLPFAPVVELEISLFDDLNNNGKRDADEPGIPFGGVRVEGPVSKSARVDGEGVAVISGLVSGTYTVTPDAARLPENYKITTTTVEVQVRTPDKPNPVAVGAAVPPREQVTTFDNQTLALFASVNLDSVPRGGEVTLEALVQGKVDRVEARFGSQTVPLQLQDGRWVAVIRVPQNTEPGALVITVRATAGSETISFEVMVQVTSAPLFEASTVRVTAGQETQIQVVTLFRINPGDLELVLPDGTRLKLQSTDGFNWSVTWKAGDQPGEFEATLVYPAGTLGTVRIVIEPPK